MQQIQRDIAQALQVQPPFQSEADVQAQIARRIAFIQQCLKDSGLKTLVLGISGGVDSLTAGLLAQRAVEQLREQTGDQAYRFIAVRLPYQVQQDEADAQASLATIRADEEQTVNIGPSVKALAEQLEALEGLEPAKSDFVIGNIKARIRMVAQYAIAGARGGLVIGTDHAAEAVMGFFTKFGDGAATWLRSAAWPSIRCAPSPAPSALRRTWWRRSPPPTSRTCAPAIRTRLPTASPMPRSTPSCTASRCARKLRG